MRTTNACVALAAPTWVVLIVCMVLGGVAAGCSPQLGAVDGGAEDFSALTRDLQSCGPLPGNLVGNPGFETPSLREGDGNGRANNHGSPPSSIPGGTLGPWDGCCAQPTGGTTWAVRTATPRCGTRTLALLSEQAAANVLNQRLDLAAYAGRGFRGSAWVRIDQAQSGAELAIDVFDLSAGRLIASSPALAATTADWRLLTVLGQVPTGGDVQLRIRSTGTLSAVVDDTSLVPE